MTPASTLRRFNRHRIALLISAMGTCSTASAQIIADPGAPASQQATILRAADGAPLVNIRTPNASGLSRNTYRQFDVGTNGVYLNNSASNPWMSNGVAATTILNEVNSTNPSLINGAVRVAGQQAQVIIANPNGISVNGGSFVNASRATLVTGAAQFSNGTLTGFDVRSGAINILAGGLNNSTTPLTDLMSRVLVLTGAVRGNSVNIVTGLQTVDIRSGGISNQDTKTYAPGALTIDTASLGGLYANTISMLATESGLGVRNAGTWQATGGQIIVTAEGQLQNTGTIRGDSVALGTVNGNIENTGTVQANRTLLINAGGDARLTGAGLVQTAAANVAIAARGNLTVGNGSANSASVSSTASGGQVTLMAGRALNIHSASVQAHGNVALRSDGGLTVNAATVQSTTGRIEALSAGHLQASNSVVTGTNVHLETGAPLREMASDITINAGNIRGTQQTTVIASGNLTVSGTGTAAPVSGAGNVHLQSGRLLTISAGTSLQATQHMSLLAGDALSLGGTGSNTPNAGLKATLTTGGNLMVSGASVTAAGSQLTTGGNLTLEATNGALVLNGLLNAGNSNAERTSLRAGGDINVHAFNGNLTANALQANARNLHFISNGNTSIANLLTQSGNNTAVVGSALEAIDDITVASIAAINNPNRLVQVLGSTLTAGGEARLIGNGLLILGTAAQRNNGVETLVRDSVTAGKLLVDAGSLQGVGASLTTNGSGTSANRSGDMLLIARTGDLHLDQRPGANTVLTASGNLSVHADRTLTLTGTAASSAKNLSLTSAKAAINTAAATLTARDILNINSADTQNHDRGTYRGGAVGVSNQLGPIRFINTATSSVASPNTALGILNGQVSIESAWGLESDALSSFRAATDLALVQGAGNLSITPVGMTRGTLSADQFSAGRHLTLSARNGTLTLAGQAGNESIATHIVDLNSVGDINLIANQLIIQGSRLNAGGNLNLTAAAGNMRIEGLRHDRTESGFLNTYWNAAQLTAHNVTARASGAIDFASVSATARNTLTTVSGTDSTFSGNYTRWRIDNRGSGGWYEDEHLLAKTVLAASTGVSLTAAGGSLILNASDVSVSNGNATLQAAGHIRLEAAEEDAVNQITYYHSSRNKFGRKKVYTTEVFNEDLTAVPVAISARDIFLKAGNNIQTFGSQLNAAGNLRLEAGDAIEYYAVRNLQVRQSNTTRSSSFLGVKYDSTRSTNTRSLTVALPTVLQSQQDILSNSGGDQLLQGTRVTYGGTASFNAGVGERPRADARIILEGVKNTLTQVQTRESNYVVWQRSVNSGSVSETLTLPSFTGPTRPTFTAPGGMTVQLPASSDFKTQIATLSAQPGLSYLNAVANRNDVNWQPVKLAFDQWNYRQEGLTANGAALLAVAVAWASGGTGAGLVGAAEGSMAAATANAAFSTLAAQASITLVNNKGDIGQTLKDLASSQTAKAALAAALTAGVMQNLGATQTMRDLSAQTGIPEKLTYNLINASGRALTTTAINGGDLESALRSALIGGAVDTAHGQVASQIGAAGFNYLAHKLAHALAGCIAGSAAQGTCRDGAIGGAVGEVVAEMFKGRVPAWTAPEAEWTAFDQQVRNLGKLVAGTVAAYAGGTAQTAITAAEIAIDNNARLNFRLQAMQQSVSPQQLYVNLRVASLQNAIRESGGLVPPNMTNPGARINYSQTDITQLEAQLGRLNPTHQLIYSQPNSTLSPIPASYINMATAVNMNNVVGAGTGATNAFGFPRDGNAYFRELLRTNPQMFSQRNKEAIDRERAPSVDTQWIQYNPSHLAFSGQMLVHHHWMQGNIAVAIPVSVHQAWYRTFHPYR